VEINIWFNIKIFCNETSEQAIWNGYYELATKAIIFYNIHLLSKQLEGEKDQDD